MSHLADINLWAVVVAALVYFFIGFLWYSVFFSKAWIKAVNITMDDEKQSFPIMPMIGQLISALLYSLGIAYVLQLTGCKCMYHWLITSIVVIFLFVFPINSGTLFFQKKYTLFNIDAGYQAVGALVISFILSIWK